VTELGVVLRMVVVFWVVSFAAWAMAGDAVVHVVDSEFQAGETKVRVVVPADLRAGERCRVLFVLPVETGDGTRWGDSVAEVRQGGLAEKHRLICVFPTFSDLPWYCDHPTDDGIRQERYLLETVVPLVEREYPVQPGAAGRLLVGFSKSGWGAWSLLLRHPDKFAKAAAWDAPLTMDEPGRYGSGPIFGTPENFERYHIAKLLERRAELLSQSRRLILMGHGGFKQQHDEMHRLLVRLGIGHDYREGPKREHAWGSGWLPEAAELLLSNGDH